MTEKLYSLDEIEAALRKAHHVAGEGILPARTIAKVSDMLSRPQPEFREGQVVHYTYICEEDVPTAEYAQLEAEDMHKDLRKMCRPLTPEEVGPGYVPVQDVRPLVEAMKDIANWYRDHCGDKLNLSHIQEHAQAALDALPDNLRELIDET